MPRSLPQLNAVRAFEAAARHVSFTRAAEELCVTQGAVSHQVKALEAELGVKLFNRERQRLIITDAGRDYLAVVRDALDRIAMGTERLVQRQSSGMLTVSTSPDFAAKWLVHRLGRFAEAHPAIDLRVSATMHHVDFAREDVDLAVRHGDGHWPGLHVTRLCGEQLFAVCSPALGARLKQPEDVLKLPLLHLDDRGPWTAWLEAAGVADCDALHGPVLNRASMLIDAASMAMASRWRAPRSRHGISSTSAWCGRSRSHYRWPSLIGSFAPRRPRSCPSWSRSATGYWRRHATTPGRCGIKSVDSTVYPAICAASMLETRTMTQGTAAHSMARYLSGLPVKASMGLVS